MLQRSMLFGDIFPIKSATCLFGVNSIECEIPHLHYLREGADNNPVMLVQTVCRLGRARAGAGGCEGRNIFSLDVAESRFWLIVVVGFIDENGNDGIRAMSPRRCKIEPFPFVANFVPDKIDAQ
jgi:hypothetical protein